MRTSVVKLIRTNLLQALLITLLLLSSDLRAVAQEKDAGLKAPPLKNKLKIADQLYIEHSYYNAIDDYEELIKVAPGNEYIKYKLGLAYFKSRDYKMAEKYLHPLSEKKEKSDYPLGIFHLGETLKMNGKYEEAKRMFLIYLKTKGNTNEDKFYKSITKNEINSCNYALDLAAYDTINNVQIKLLPGEVNNPYSDFSPQRLADDTILFASLRSDTIIKIKYQSEEVYPVKLFISVKEDSLWDDPREFEEYNHDFHHTANGAYSQDKKLFVFSRCRPDKNYETVCTLYFSRFLNGKWTRPGKLGNGINKRGYSSTQPAFGITAKSIAKRKVIFPVLYFVSNQAGGRGKMDIWYSEVNERGLFGKPLNCGARINTPRDEITPFYDSDTRILYFSSNYHWNAGGFDVFKSSGTLNRWSKPENMSLSVNTSYDDTYFAPDKNGKGGFVVSNRPGGMALKSETCCDDIYEVKTIAPPMLALKGTILPEETHPVKSVRNVTVGIIASARLKKHLSKFKDVSRLKDSIQWVSHSDSLGNFNFETSKAKNYSIIFAKDSFEIKVFPIDSLRRSLVDSHSPWLVKMDLLKETSGHRIFRNDSTQTSPEDSLDRSTHDLKKLTVSTASELNIGDVFILDNMYFDYDKDLIKKESIPALNLLMKFLTTHQNIKVEIGGHTDSHASVKHNLDLSKRRANRIRNYVISKGIDKNRLVAVGYGEEFPIALNENADGSDNPDGRKLNRRTEIKILGNVNED